MCRPPDEGDEALKDCKKSLDHRTRQGRTKEMSYVPGVFSKFKLGIALLPLAVCRDVS